MPGDGWVHLGSGLIPVRQPWSLVILSHWPWLAPFLALKGYLIVMEESFSKLSSHLQTVLSDLDKCVDDFAGKWSSPNLPTACAFCLSRLGAVLRMIDGKPTSQIQPYIDELNRLKVLAGSPFVEFEKKCFLSFHEAALANAHVIFGDAAKASNLTKWSDMACGDDVCFEMSDFHSGMKEITNIFMGLPRFGELVVELRREVITYEANAPRSGLAEELTADEAEPAPKKKLAELRERCAKRNIELEDMKPDERLAILKEEFPTLALDKFRLRSVSRTHRNRINRNNSDAK